MTTETPLTCYICGRTSDDWITVDMIGLFEDQAAATDRFREKHDADPESYLFVCPDCDEENPYHAENCRKSMAYTNECCSQIKFSTSSIDR